MKTIRVWLYKYKVYEGPVSDVNFERLNNLPKFLLRRIVLVDWYISDNSWLMLPTNWRGQSND